MAAAGVAPSWRMTQPPAAVTPAAAAKASASAPAPPQCPSATCPMLARALPKSMTREAQALIRLHDLPVRPAAASCRKMMSLLEAACPGRGRALAFALVDLKRADALAKAPACRGYAVELDAMAARVRAEVAAGCPLTVRELPVGGGDVIRERGLEPGPGVGLVLDALLAAVLAGELGLGREELLAELRMGE